MFYWGFLIFPSPYVLRKASISVRWVGMVTSIFWNLLVGKASVSMVLMLRLDYFWVVRAAALFKNEVPPLGVIEVLIIFGTARVTWSYPKVSVGCFCFYLIVWYSFFESSRTAFRAYAPTNDGAISSPTLTCFFPSAEPCSFYPILMVTVPCLIWGLIGWVGYCRTVFPPPAAFYRGA